MANQIVIQPNGKYAIYSTITENLSYINCSKKEIVDILVSEQREYIKIGVDTIISKLKNGDKPYYQFTKSFNEILETLKDVHGEEKMLKIKAEIEKK